MSLYHHVAIVGAVPVGSLLAVLFRLNDFDVSLYEKRVEATRSINLHTTADLFHLAQSLNPTDDSVFMDLVQQLEHNHNAVLIRDLETTLRQKAVELVQKIN